MKVIKKKVASRNPRVQLLTLELLGQAVETCGLPLHTQVSSKDSIVILSSLVKNRETDPEVKSKLISLVQRWGVKFQDSQDILPGFSELYNSLRQAGVPFSGVAEVPRPVAEPMPQAPIRPLASSTPSRIPPQKLTKLKADLGVVRDNVKLTNEMMDASEPGPALTQNEVLSELVNTLRAMQGKLGKLIESVGDEELVGLGIQVKDEVDDALRRYQELREGRKTQGKPQAAKQMSMLDMDLELPPSAPQTVQVEKPREVAPVSSNPLPFDIFGSTPPPPLRPMQSDPLVFGAPQVPAFPTDMHSTAFPAAFPPAQPVAYTAPPAVPQSYPAAPVQPVYVAAPVQPVYAPPPAQQVSYTAPAQPVQKPTYPQEPRIKHNMMKGAEENKSADSGKPKDLFDDLVQL